MHGEGIRQKAAVIVEKDNPLNLTSDTARRRESVGVVKFLCKIVKTNDCGFTCRKCVGSSAVWD